MPPPNSTTNWDQVFKLPRLLGTPYLNHHSNLPIFKFVKLGHMSHFLISFYQIPPPNSLLLFPLLPFPVLLGPFAFLENSTSMLHTNCMHVGSNIHVKSSPYFIDTHQSLPEWHDTILGDWGKKDEKYEISLRLSEWTRRTYMLYPQACLRCYIISKNPGNHGLYI